MDHIEILHICPQPLFSGLEQYALMLAKMQKEAGQKVGFVVLKGSALETECKKAAIPIYIVETDRRLALMNVAQQYANIFKRMAALQVIHLHTSKDIGRLALALFMTKWPKKRPKVIQQNHIWISHSKRDPLHWLTHKTLDEIWCSSEPARRDLVKYLPYPPSKIQIVKYGRNLEATQNSFLSKTAAREELGLPINATVLGAIARIDRGKGIWELLEGAMPVLNEHPKFHLVIIGGPTLTDPKAIAFAEKVENFHRDLPEELRSRVHLKGSIPDAGRFLPAFDVYAQVAYKETFSLALLDAQMAGLPVLGTNSGGTPEVVREGQTGWLCEPENSESLTLALKCALNDQANWSNFGATARARVLREFDIRVVLADIMKRYELDSAAI